MDKFVYKKPRNLQERVKRSPQKKSLRQSTLHSLAGVVVIEELEQYKTILESDNESVEKKLEVLNKLLAKNPSKEILIKVGIGKTVRRLSRGGDGSDDKREEVERLSDKVYRKWRYELERKIVLRSTPITVKSDKETERLRESSVKFLRSALIKEESQAGRDSLCRGLEVEIFNQSQKLVNNSYRKLSRKVIFGLQSQDRRSDLVSGRVSIREFVSQYS